MGKRIRVQRRGRGGSTFRASSHKRVAQAQYPLLDKGKYMDAIVEGKIMSIVHDPGRGTPLALVTFRNGIECHMVIPEGVFEGQNVQMGSRASVDVGNILPLISIPEGTIVCNIELRPGDGGKVAKASGAYATVVGHTSQGTIVKLPSGKTKYLNDHCRATVGVVSGAGRTEKPFLKSGAKFHWMKAKGHKYPRTRGRAMIAAVHPYGSSKRGARKVTTVSRHAAPGRKVGLIAARGAGKRKRR